MFLLTEAEFNRMLELAIKRLSVGPWTFISHMVLKCNGGWRPRRDYVVLDRATGFSGHPLFHKQDLTSLFSDCRFSSLIDLVRANIHAF